jgi:chorismate mutase/prephenate dehydratase
MIETLRERMDALDRRLLALVNGRAALACRIAEEKRARGMPLHAPGREAAILRRVRSRNRGPLGKAAVERIFRCILVESRALAAKKSIT